jgi:hypothetical protein
MPFLNGTDVDRIEQARKHIVAQIAERNDQYPAFGPVFPWTLVNRAQSYVFDLPAESLRRIRLHADAMNGIRGSSEYLRLEDGATYCRDTGYLFLGEGVPIDKWAREYDLPGMEDLKFGVQYQGLTVGSITGQRQQNICNLYRVLDGEAQRLIFVEIGAGYGSFALDMRQILPDCAYVIVDLPETLLYSAVYLSAHRPDLRAYVYAPGDDVTAVLAQPDAFDFAFIPNYRAPTLDALPHIDIGFNSVSFPEMTEATVRQYLGLIAPKLKRFFMSVNYRQPADVKHIGVDNLLAERFRLFPTPEDYRSQLGLSDAEYDDHNFRPTFIGVTDACPPLKDFELHCFDPIWGHLKIRKLGDRATIEDMKGARTTSAAPPEPKPTTLRRLLRLFGGSA